MTTQAGARDAAAIEPSPEILIEEIRGIESMRRVEDLQAAVWGSNPAWTVPSHVLHVVSECGGILLGAEDDGRLIGFVLGFLGRQDGRLYHASHMLGILPSYQQHGIGAAL